MYWPMHQQIHRPILEHLLTGRVSVKCRPMYQLIYQLISTNTFSEGKVSVKHRCSIGKPSSISTDSSIGWYISWYSTDISNVLDRVSPDSRSSIDQCIDWYITQCIGRSPHKIQDLVFYHWLYEIRAPFSSPNSSVLFSCSISNSISLKL